MSVIKDLQLNGAASFFVTSGLFLIRIPFPHQDVYIKQQQTFRALFLAVSKLLCKFATVLIIINIVELKNKEMMKKTMTFLAMLLMVMAP